MILEGTVTNVAAFGAFVDIGVHQDGLVHISAMSKTFIKDPREVVKPGDIVKVKVLEVEIERKRIALTLRLDDEPRIEERTSGTRRAARQFTRADDIGGAAQAAGAAAAARSPTRCAAPARKAGTPRGRVGGNSDLILSRAAWKAARVEGWSQASVPDAILRDARLRPSGYVGLLRMRSEVSFTRS